MRRIISSHFGVGDDLRGVHAIPWVLQPAFAPRIHCSVPVIHRQTESVPGAWLELGLRRHGHGDGSTPTGRVEAGGMVLLGRMLDSAYHRPLPRPRAGSRPPRQP
jgi:hypothetical protein